MNLEQALKDASDTILRCANNVQAAADSLALSTGRCHCGGKLHKEFLDFGNDDNEMVMKCNQCQETYA